VLKVWAEVVSSEREKGGDERAKREKGGGEGEQRGEGGENDLMGGDRETPSQNVSHLEEEGASSAGESRWS